MSTASFGLGWCENVKSFLPLARVEAMTFGATIKGRCVYARSDNTTPAIALEDFRDGTTANASLLYLSGHGGNASSGFDLPAGESLRADNVKIGGETRWLVLDSCAAFESSRFVDPMAWGDIFDGLHQLLGASVFVPANPDRAQRFAEYLNEGEPVQKAWAQAVEETSAEVAWAVMALRVDGVTDETFLAPASGTIGVGGRDSVELLSPTDPGLGGTP